MEDYILPFQWTSDEFSSGVARNTLSRLRNGGADLAGWAAAECGQEYAEGADATGRAADSGEHELPLHPPSCRPDRMGHCPLRCGRRDERLDVGLGSPRVLPGCHQHVLQLGRG